MPIENCFLFRKFNISFARSRKKHFYTFMIYGFSTLQPVTLDERKREKSLLRKSVQTRGLNMLIPNE